VLRDDRTSGEGPGRAARNVLGEALEICSIKPMTGFYRDGCCNTGREDIGSHTVCVVMTSAFLEFPNRAATTFQPPTRVWLSWPQTRRSLVPVCGPLARSSRCKPSAPGDLACYPRRCLGPLHAWRSQTLRSGSRVTIETRGVSAFSRRPRHNQARAAHSGIHHGRRCACVADQNLDFVDLGFRDTCLPP
jgi:hypothetical protein